MSTTEQIVWAHRVDKDADVKPGATLRVYADLLPASDGTAPFSIHTFNQITGGDAIFPRQAAVANDHFVFTGKQDDDKQTAIGRQFARHHGIEKPYYATPGDGIFHFYFPEQGLVLPGQFIPGADSHSRAYGAYGAVGMGVGSTTLGFGWSTGYIYFTMAKQRRVTFTGAAARVGHRQGHRPRAAAAVGREAGAGRCRWSWSIVTSSCRFAFRNTIANMMAEAEALNGIFAPDEIDAGVVRRQGHDRAAVPAFGCGADAVFEIDEQLVLGEVTPMIAKPFSPGNAFAAEEVALERLTFDKAMIGSCTNGSYDDLLSAAMVLVAARAQGLTKAVKELVVFPGSGGVKLQIERPDPRLNGESIADVFRAAGGEIRASWCGPCFGQGPDALTAGSARSPRSIATGRTAWGLAGKATSRRRRWSRPRRSRVTWRRRANSGWCGILNDTESDDLTGGPTLEVE